MEESMDLHEEAGKENEQTLANLSLPEEVTSKDEVEIEKFLQESKNTQYKTKSDLNAWKKFCESLKESRAIENIPANELDLLLSKIFIFVRKQNGTEYKDVFAAAKLFLSVRKTSVGRLLEADVQPNFVAQLSGHKNLKSLDSYHSASLKWTPQVDHLSNLMQLN